MPSGEVSGRYPVELNDHLLSQRRPLECAEESSEAMIATSHLAVAFHREENSL